MTIPTFPFKVAMTKIDEDIATVNASPVRRGTLYYAVKIDGRKAEIVARSTLGRNNRPRLDFLLKTPSDATSYSMLYLTEIDIISVLASLDQTLYDHIKQSLAKLYHETADLKHTVIFSRDALVQDLDAISVAATKDVAYISDTSTNPLVTTPFGHPVSFRSFCDLVSLMLSKESSEKQKWVIAKYCILADVARQIPLSITIPSSLEDIHDITTVEALYESGGPSLWRENQYDRITFTSNVAENYFKSLK